MEARLTIVLFIKYYNEYYILGLFICSCLLYTICYAFLQL